MRWAAISMVMLIALAFAACEQSPKVSETQPVKVHIDRELVQMHRLFHDLVKDLTRSDQIFTLKSASDERKALIVKISEEAKADVVWLKAYYKDRPHYVGDHDLPAGEREVRSDIAQVTAGRLVFAGKKTFERDLMITHISAMEYAMHLLRVMKKHEKDEAGEAWVKTRISVYQGLYNALKNQLVVKPEG